MFCGRNHRLTAGLFVSVVCILLGLWSQITVCGRKKELNERKMEISRINGEDENSKKETCYHKQLEICTTRPAYRQGRKFTAVKVYSVSSESQHLFIYGVPTINLRSELKSLFNRYGEIISMHVVPQQKVEMFTECYHVHYRRIQSARIAKRFVDTKSFYGGILHVCYAPEYETLEETTIKLLARKKDVLQRLNKYNAELDEKYSEVKTANEGGKGEQGISGKKNRFKLDISNLHTQSDSILSHKEKQKRNAEENISKYTSQCSVVKGGPCDRMMSSLRNNSKKFVPLPLRYESTSMHQMYGPQLPNYTVPSRDTKKMGDIVSSQDNVERIQDNLGGYRHIHIEKDIRKMPYNVEKRIVFRNKIQNKIS